MASRKDTDAVNDLPFFRGGEGALGRGRPAYFSTSEVFAKTYGPVTEYRLRLQNPKFVDLSEWGGFSTMLRFDPSPAERLRADGYDSVVYVSDTPSGKMYTIFALDGTAVAKKKNPRAAIGNPRAKIGKSIGMVVMDAGRGSFGLIIFDTKKILALRSGADPEAMDAVKGVMALSKSKRCRGALEVTAAAAQKGYGPMLYDVAMTLAQLQGSPGVIPDRKSVSKAARAVWKYSSDKRSDIEGLTPGWACRRHGDDVLDAIYHLKKPLRGYKAMIDRGLKTAQTLEDRLGTDEALDLLGEARATFWNCYYHSKCPVPSPAGLRRAV